jgi:hypothetical protein
MTLKEALKQRDEASAACMELIAEMRKLIQRLRATHYSIADADAHEAELMIQRICKGGKAYS